jgi:flagellar protein FlaI
MAKPKKSDKKNKKRATPRSVDEIVRKIKESRRIREKSAPEAEPEGVPDEDIPPKMPSSTMGPAPEKEAMAPMGEEPAMGGSGDEGDDEGGEDEMEGAKGMMGGKAMGASMDEGKPGAVSSRSNLPDPDPLPERKEIPKELEVAAMVERTQEFEPVKGRESARHKVLDSYTFLSEAIPVEVSIVHRGDFVPIYNITIPGIAGGTKLLLETKLRAELISDVKLDITEILDPKKQVMVRAKFQDSAMKVLGRNFAQLPESKRKILASYLIQNTLGLGELETPLHDDFLEEVVVNNSRDPVWVYHKKYGWCKTNLRLKNEERIYDYAALVARKVGRQINILSPLLDAHLPSGDRVNATLFPVSNYGNTLTIRRFSRNPWTITNLIRGKTISPEVAATIWLAVQSELSLIVAGGTGSGKTSFLNAMSGLIPANQRIISIEDTRELTLPSFLHWVPMVTREPNPEGKGEVSMLDLMINALRQRPDRIVVGEVRRQREAEVLFEAMHTGHSVYATVHADNAEQTISRLVNPPINVPEENLDALAGIVVQYRQRRKNVRRTLEFAEVQRRGKLNTIYRWDSKRDVTVKSGKLNTIASTIELYSGLTPKEIDSEIAEKVSVLNWMVKNGYEAVNEVGSIVSRYYQEPEEVLGVVQKKGKWEF